jgi:selenoprotein W-related protein
VGLINELLGDKQIESQIESLKIIPAGDGKFEVTVNSDLVYSKLATGRHANRGEVRGLIKAKIG